MTIALIDADILVYRVGFASEDQPSGIALARLRETFGGILRSLELQDYIAFLTSTDHSNFRYQIFPEYKANRKQPKPIHYDLLRAALEEDYGAKVIYGEEADDAIGVENTKREGDAIVVTIDKDLKQLPGKHFNFVKSILFTVTPEEGLKYFYNQLLMGDRTDNIPGLTGIGEKKAAAALARAGVEEHMFKIAQDMYKKEFPDTWESEMLRNGQLLKIRQKENELWAFPDVDAIQTERSATNDPD
jgi:5'-3' exonuclease